MIDSDQAVHCWGHSGTKLDALPGAFTHVSGGKLHTCGVRTDATVACWGEDNKEQLQVSQEETFNRVAAGRFHTCGVKTDGGLHCWGSDAFNELDAPGGTFVDASAGYNHTCAIAT